MLTPELLWIETVIAEDMARPSGRVHILWTSNCDGFARWLRSHAHSATAIRSQRSSPRRKRGSRHAGAIQISPAKRNRKNRRPKAKGKRPEPCALADMLGGMSVATAAIWERRLRRARRRSPDPV